MEPPSKHSRVDLVELKVRLMKRIGPERLKQYFHCLNKLLSLKLSKVKFDKVCLRILGRENVRLHNILIRSALKNACIAKAPPLPVTTCDGQQIGDFLLSPSKARLQGSSRLHADIVVSENGDLISHDAWRPVQQHQELSDKADNGRDALLLDPEKLCSTKASADGFLSEDSRDQTEVSVVEDGKVSYIRSSLQARLRTPLYSGSISGARRRLPSVRCAKSYDSGRLLDSKTLWERMQQIAALEGLEGVSIDCADILSNGLDFYLKRLITMSIKLVGTREGCNNTVKHCLYGKLGNGVRISATHHNQVKNSSLDLEGINEKGSYKPISLLDFKVAMELNPQSLRADWQIILEKIYMHSFKE